MDKNIGEPSGSTDPVSHLQQSGETSSSEARIFHCEFPDCGRVFKTKTGRGVHHQKVHKDWYDAKQPREQLKASWNSEETALLARQEARLLAQGFRFINQDLSKFFTIELWNLSKVSGESLSTKLLCSSYLRRWALHKLNSRLWNPSSRLDIILFRDRSSSRNYSTLYNRAGSGVEGPPGFFGIYQDR